MAVLRKLIVWTTISYWQYLYICWNKIRECLIIFRHLSYFKETSILNKPFQNFCLFSTKNGQHKKKWPVFSVSEPQSCLGLGASLKLWLNLCSFKWLNFNCSLDNLITTGSWIEKRDLCFKSKNSLNIDLRSFILSAFLMYSPSLYHSLTWKGKNDCLKCLVLALKLLILFWSDALSSYI